MYKNGGVGALGQMGTQEAAVRAERWAWVTITRKEGELRTYVNGRLCAEVKLQTKEDEAKKRKGKEKAEREARGGKERADREGGEGGEGGGAGSGGAEGGGGGGDGKRQTAAERRQVLAADHYSRGMFEEARQAYAQAPAHTPDPQPLAPTLTPSPNPNP